MNDTYISEIDIILKTIHENFLNFEFECDVNKDKYSLFNGDSIFSGNLGLVLFYYNHFKVTNERKSKDRAIFLIENIIQRVIDGKSSLNNCNFSYGLAGLMKMMEHLKSEEFISYDEQDFTEIYSLSKEWIIERILNDDTEFISGAFGTINSFLNNIIKEPEFLNEIITLLENKVITAKRGKYLYILNPIVPDYPGCINLSLSHGLCGVILILLEFLKKGVENYRILNIVEDFIDYLLDNITKVDFPNKIYCYSDIVIYPDNREKRNSRLAWCYGDINIAIVLLKAGEILKNEKYTRIAEEIAITTTQRKSYEQTYIKDSQFCHGSSGLSHIYFHFYKKTKNEQFLLSRHYWLDKTIEYLKIESRENSIDNLKNRAELLEGNIGTSLVLLSHLAFIEKKDLSWDEIFLLS